MKHPEKSGKSDLWDVIQNMSYGFGFVWMSYSYWGVQAAALTIAGWAVFVLLIDSLVKMERTKKNARDGDERHQL